MQRLTGLLEDKERGAVSVVVALVMVVLIGFAAVAVDGAAIWSDRQQLQTGADAAALAIAQDCARNNCGSPAQTAQTMAAANINDGEATATIADPGLSPATGTVTVRNTGVTEHWFAPVLGHDETTITRQATAGWGSPSGGVAVLPLAFSWCEFRAQTGGGLPSGTTERTILFSKTSGATCTGPSGNVVPGGFGWVDPDAGACTAASVIAEVLTSSTGESVPTGCTVADFQALQGKTVLLPIFDQAGGTGSSAWYRVYGYAAFTITGYHFVGQYSWNGSPECKGSVRCIKGYFTQMVDLTEAFDYSTGAPALGAAVVSLTQ